MFKLNDLLKISTDKEAVSKFLTEQARKDIMKWINAELIPNAKEAIRIFNEKLREQAEKESGWCKIRDAFFIPTCLNVVVWFFTNIGKLIEEETKDK